MGIPDEINRRIRQDPRLRAVMQKIEAGKADFSDTAHYFYRAADIRGEVLSEHVLEMPPEARTEACEGVLRKCYTDTCETLDGVQGALDDELGISIAPQHPDYPQERVEQVAQSLADPTVPDETIERRARSATANIAKSFHDAYMKENAGFRSRAGLKCYITRNSGGKCCDWCADLDGRYEYGSEPKDVYARHDNCSCSVTYENGRQRQNVWSKQTWEVPVVGAGAPEPVRYTAATAPQGVAPTVLTGGQNPAIMKNIILPPETSQIRSMAPETKKLISEAFDKIMKMYDVRLSEIATEPLSDNDRNVPFQFQPVRGNNGELGLRVVINSRYDFMGSQEEMQARIMRNFNRGVLASNSILGLIAHELAHVMTFQSNYSYTGYIIDCKSVAKRIVYGISGYATGSNDGAECIAEAFAAMMCGLPISAEAQTLVDEFIERWRK